MWRTIRTGGCAYGDQQGYAGRAESAVLPDIDLKRNYKLVRGVVGITHYHIRKPFYTVWDHTIDAWDHEIPVRHNIFPMTEENRKTPVVGVFHGGNWVTGNIDSYDKVCANLAKNTGHTVLSVDYRLAPEYRFPAGLEDCYLALQEAFAQAELLGTKPEQITLIGDSAGGNLAAAVSLLTRPGRVLPGRQILIYPAPTTTTPTLHRLPPVRENGTDFLLTSKRIRDYMELYLSNEQDRESPYFAPLLAEDLSEQPKTLVITAAFDPLRDEGEAYGEKLRAAGNSVEIHRVEDALHGFFSLPPRFRRLGSAMRSSIDF
ncbi:MAG: alpha/beta hydrolase [Oscillospiraceae bacterium]